MCPFHSGNTFFFFSSSFFFSPGASDVRTLPHYVFQHQGPSWLTARRQCIRILQVVCPLTWNHDRIYFIIFDCKLLMVIFISSKERQISYVSHKSYISAGSSHWITHTTLSKINGYIQFLFYFIFCIWYIEA